jgi:hypothetical protein
MNTLEIKQIEDRISLLQSWINSIDLTNPREVIDVKFWREEIKELNDKLIYMTAPTDSVFNEMQEIATKIWNTYDNTYGYVSEKVNYVNSIGNIQDNAMVFYRMFDWENQAKFRAMATTEVLTYINANN